MPGFISLRYRSNLLSGRLAPLLDHCRWIAAVLVCLAHLRNLLFPDISQVKHIGLLGKLFYFITLFGTQAVVVFFVISGFLVGGSIVRNFKNKTFSATDYAIDRISRLYIVLIPTIILTLLMQMGGLTETCKEPSTLSNIFGNFFLLQNIILQPLCNNHPLWSLSSEAFFYIAAPFCIFAVISRSKVAFFCVAFFALIMAVTWTGTYSSLAFGSVLWAFGLLPWFVRLEIQPFILLVIFLVIISASRLHLLGNDFTSDLALAISFSALIASGFSHARQDKVTDHVGTKLAGFSYSLYLVHMPIGQAIASKIPGKLNPSNLHSYLIYGAAVLAILLFAWLFGFLFERRTSDLRRWLRTGWSARIRRA